MLYKEIEGIDYFGGQGVVRLVGLEVGGDEEQKDGENANESIEV